MPARKASSTPIPTTRPGAGPTSVAATATSPTTARRWPVAGVAGRDSGGLRAKVVDRTDRATLEAFVGQMARPGAMVYTDESSAYAGLKGLGLGHATVCHSAGEWARDDDGDGIREVHDNTLEGIWTGLRNYLRIFRGVSKHYLKQYVAIFLWAYNIKSVSDHFLRGNLEI
jgi:transposase